MARTLRLLHTAQAHVARFDALRDAIAPDAELVHIVRGDLLDRARAEGLNKALRADLAAELGHGPTLCTCTTLGPAAEAAGAIRIDRPMMDAAARLGGRLLLAVVLESTEQACRDSLNASIDVAGTQAEIDTLVMPEVWPLFEAGDTAGFARAVAERVNAALTGHSGVVLAQVSMTDAASLVSHANVLTAPERALRFALSR